MKHLGIFFLTALSSTTVLAGHADSVSFQSVPAMNEIVLFTLAITAGLAGAWGIRQLRNKK